MFVALNRSMNKINEELNKITGSKRKGCSTNSIFIIRCLFNKYNWWCAGYAIRRQSLLFRWLDCEYLHCILIVICYCNLHLCLSAFVQVFQRRFNGQVVFHTRTWNEYRDGFGDVNTEFWLGKRPQCLIRG